jgi:hypothetical protein
MKKNFIPYLPNIKIDKKIYINNNEILNCYYQEEEN